MPSIATAFGIGPTDAVKLFPVLARRQNLKRFLAHNASLSENHGRPGDIAELGVYRGLGLMTWANLLEAFCIGDRTKMVFGFDNWAGFAGFSPQDGAEKESAGKTVGGFNPTDYKRELLSAIDIFDNDRFIPWKPRIKLIDGDITLDSSVLYSAKIRASAFRSYTLTAIFTSRLMPRSTRSGLGWRGAASSYLTNTASTTGPAKPPRSTSFWPTSRTYGCKHLIGPMHRRRGL